MDNLKIATSFSLHDELELENLKLATSFSLLDELKTDELKIVTSFSNTYGPRRWGHGREPKKYGPRMEIWMGQRPVWVRGERSDPRTQTGLWPIQISIRGPYLLCLSRPLGRDKTKESIGQGLWPSPMRFGWPPMSASTRTIRNICSKLDQKSNFTLLLTNRHREDTQWHLKMLYSMQTFWVQQL